MLRIEILFSKLNYEKQQNGPIFPDFGIKNSEQGVAKRCRFSWLTNSALVYEPKCGGRGELLGLSQ
jgi:hypothetical protein